MDVLRLGLLLITVVARYSIDASFGVTQVPTNNITAANALRKQLLKNYDQIVIPSTSKNLVHVNLDVMFNAVELNYETSQMIIHAYLKLKWDDIRLTWNPAEYDQIEYTTVNHLEIWHPDVMAYNNIELNPVVHGPTLSLVNSFGTVMWIQPVQYRVHCEVDMTRWPYDTQIGVLKVGSWVYSNHEINLTVTAQNTINLSSHSEWKISQVTDQKVSHVYPCCPNKKFDHAEYNITIDRKGCRYHPVVYLPALSTALLNVLVFWISLDDKCKLLTSLFNALFVVVIMTIVYSKIPLILSTVPFIVMYYTYSLGLIVLTTIISVTLQNMTTTSKPLSRSVKRFSQMGFIEYLGKKLNASSSDDQAKRESREEIDEQNVDLNKRRLLAKVIDRICFFVFSFIYLILLSHFVF